MATKIVKKKEVKKAKKFNSALWGKRIWVGIIIFFSLFAIISGIAIYNSYRNSYVATMAGEKITVAEFDYFLHFEKYYMVTSVKDPAMDEATFWATTIDGKFPLIICKENALESAREFNIQMLKVKENGIKLDAAGKEQVQTYIDNLVSTSYTWTQKQDYVKTNIGITYNDYKRIIRDYYLISRMEEEVKAGIEISEEEISAYYEENRDTLDKVTINDLTIAFKDYMTEEQLNATDSTPTTEQKEQARQDAVKYLTRLQNGEDFTAIVKEYMGDKYTADTKIEYTFTSGDTSIVEGIRTWAFSSETVEFNMIETDSGFDIVQLISRTTYEDVKADAKSAILTDKYNKLLEEWKASPDYAVVLKQDVYDKIQ